MGLIEGLLLLFLSLNCFTLSKSNSLLRSRVESLEVKMDYLIGNDELTEVAAWLNQVDE